MHKMTKTHFNILLIADDPGDVFFIREIIQDIREYTYDITHVSKISEAATECSKKNFDVVLTDLGLPDSSGIETVNKVLALVPSKPIVVLTGLNDEKAGTEAILAGAQDHIIKGQNSAALLSKSINYSYRRQQIKNQLNKSENRFRGIVENMEDGIALIENKAITYVNKRFELMTGYTQQTLKKIIEGKGDENNTIVNYINKTNKFDQPVEDEKLWITNKNGQSFYVQCRVTTNLGQEHSKCVILTDNTEAWKNLTMNDFTNQLLNFNIIDAKENYFKILHKILSQKFINKHIAFGLIENEEVDFFKFENNSIVSTTIPKEKCPGLALISAKKDVAFNTEELRNAVKEKDFEFPFGEPCSFMGVGLKNDERCIGIISISDPVHDQAFDAKDLNWVQLIAKQTSYVIQKNKQDEKIKQFSSSVEQSPACVVITNIRGNIEYVNPFFEKTTGYTFEEVLNKNSRILQSGQTPEKTYKELWDAITAGKTWKGVFVNKKKNGEIFYEEASIAGVKNNDNRITHYVAVKTDITNRILRERELEEAKIHAQESDKLKSMFLTNLSHEIRTPLNGIMGFSKLLGKPDISRQDINKYVKIIEKSGRLLLSTVHNILDLSSLQSGHMAAHKTNFSLNDLIKDVYEEYTPLFQKKGLKWTLKNDIEAQKPQIITDKDLLKKLLMHLVNNALKFTNDGQVDLEMGILEDKLHINVCDTGIGIPRSHKEKIFDCFVQADMKENRVHQGPGIGLTIAKGISEILESDLTLESEEDKGSKFSILFPQSMVKIKEIETTDNTKKTKITEHSNVKVLIVEDDDVSALYLETLLRDLKFTTIRAIDGLEATRVFKENRDVEMIIMDINLPGQSGLKATAQIRKIDPNVIIIAQTAYTDKHNMESALSVGCNEFMTKPIIKEDLADMLQKYYELDVT